jgi:uncharacterized membrane protein HdeD (DUF308 family)
MHALSKRWSLLLLRGLAAIAFGLLAWARPAASLAALVFLFGIFAIVDGILEISTALDRDEGRWIPVLAGVISILVGVLTFMAPQVTAIVLLFYIAVWAMVRGVLDIVLAVRLRREIQGEWRLVLAGVASITFGALLLARPGAGALTIVWLIGAYAIVAGVLLTMFAFKVRSLGSRSAPPRPPAAAVPAGSHLEK